MTERKVLDRIGTAEDLMKWAHSAQHGDAVIYYEGLLYNEPVAPPNEARFIADEAMRLCETGRFLLTQRFVRTGPESDTRLRLKASFMMQRYIDTQRDLRAIVSNLAGLIRHAPPDNVNAHYYEYIITRSLKK